MAELVDAHDSGSCPSNGVQVQLLPRAPLLWPFPTGTYGNLFTKTSMSHHQYLERCAGKCAGLVFLKPPSNKKYIKVKDRRGQPVRGLWLRCGTYYARITVEDPDGGKRDRRFSLDASSFK